MFQKNILSELIRICYQAGVLIMDIYNKEFEINYKSDRSPVTNADKSAEEYILKNYDYATRLVDTSAFQQVSPFQR